MLAGDTSCQAYLVTDVLRACRNNPASQRGCDRPAAYEECIAPYLPAAGSSLKTSLVTLKKKTAQSFRVACSQAGTAERRARQPLALELHLRLLRQRRRQQQQQHQWACLRSCSRLPSRQCTGRRRRLLPGSSEPCQNRHSVACKGSYSCNTGRVG